MTKNEKLLAAELLEYASEEFGFNVCNDYFLPNTQENVDLLNAMEEWNCRDNKKDLIKHTYDPTNGELVTADWYLMSYLASRLKD
jgi:hypothetical protein